MRVCCGWVWVCVLLPACMTVCPPPPPAMLRLIASRRCISPSPRPLPPPFLTDSIATGRWADLLHWVPATALTLTAGTAIWSTYYLQSAMAIFPNNLVVPTYYVSFTLCSVCAGATVYREFDCMNASQPPLFAAGCLTTFIGVFLTAAKEQPARAGASGAATDAELSPMTKMLAETPPRSDGGGGGRVRSFVEPGSPE